MNKYVITLRRKDGSTKTSRRMATQPATAVLDFCETNDVQAIFPLTYDSSERLWYCKARGADEITVEEVAA